MDHDRCRMPRTHCGVSWRLTQRSPASASSVIMCPASSSRWRAAAQNSGSSRCMKVSWRTGSRQLRRPRACASGMARWTRSAACLTATCAVPSPPCRARTRYMTTPSCQARSSTSPGRSALAPLQTTTSHFHACGFQPAASCRSGG